MGRAYLPKVKGRLPTPWPQQEKGIRKWVSVKDHSAAPHSSPSGMAKSPQKWGCLQDSLPGPQASNGYLCIKPALFPHAEVPDKPVFLLSTAMALTLYKRAIVNILDAGTHLHLLNPLIVEDPLKPTSHLRTPSTSFYLCGIFIRKW